MIKKLVVNINGLNFESPYYTFPISHIYGIAKKENCELEEKFKALGFNRGFPNSCLVPVTRLGLIDDRGTCLVAYKNLIFAGTPDGFNIGSYEIYEEKVTASTSLESRCKLFNEAIQQCFYQSWLFFQAVPGLDMVWIAAKLKDKTSGETLFGKCFEVGPNFSEFNKVTWDFDYIVEWLKTPTFINKTICKDRCDCQRLCETLRSPEAFKAFVKSRRLVLANTI